MRQSKQNSNVAFLYVRLSRDDELEGESYSITNQTKLLTKVAKEKGYSKTVVFCDDGVSGVTMNRPDFNRMLEQLKLGKASAVFVKDLSRLGRNYLEVGKLIEEFFPENNIRLIAVSDNIDTFDGYNELTPIRNLFNEWYARDISKKRRTSNKIKGMSGEPLGQPPYGYIKSPDNRKKWLVDDEAAAVVKRIYFLFLSGLGIEQIAIKLTEEKVLTPTEYAKHKKISKPTSATTDIPNYWRKATVAKILSNQEYCGDIINFKTYSISYKNKKRYQNSPENIMVFKDANEAIIERSQFNIVQEMRSRGRKKKMKTGETNMFSGLLRCSDCGGNLHYHFNSANPDIKYFNCANFNKGSRKTCFSTHYIRVDFLEKIVLSEIRRLTQFACHYENEFINAVSKYSEETLKNQAKVLENELNLLISRDKEIDSLFERIYEDNVSGKISDERFAKMSCKYEDEQREIEASIETTREKYIEISEKSFSTESFMKAIKKYTRVRKLTSVMLHELIEYIEVFNAETVNGVKKQNIVIHYNCIGSISIPENIPLKEPEITVPTRKGVTVNYLPQTTAG